MYQTSMKEQTEGRRGVGKVLTGEGERHSRSCMKCWLQEIYDESVPTRGYM